MFSQLQGQTFLIIAAVWRQTLKYSIFFCNMSINMGVILLDYFVRLKLVPVQKEKRPSALLGSGCKRMSFTSFLMTLLPISTMHLNRMTVNK